MKKILLIAFVAVTLCFNACKKENAVTGVSLNMSEVELKVGESTTVKAIVEPDDATNKDVRWSINDTSIATVENGVVTGVSSGETSLTVTTVDGGYTATIPINVIADKVAVTGILLDKTEVGLLIGEHTTVEAVVTPNNATNKEVEWSIGDSSIASVENGVVKGISLGETELTAKTVDGGFTATIPVKVVAKKIAVTGVSLNMSEVELNIGDNTTIEAIVTPSDATDKSVEWTIENTLIATVTCGVVTGVSEGETTLTVTTIDGGFTASIPVKVSKKIIAVTGISLNKNEIGMAVGNSKTVEAIIEPEDATDKSVEWTIGDSSIASVENGVVTGLALGETELTAKTVDGGFTATIPVKVVAEEVAVTGVSFNVNEISVAVGDSKTVEAAVEPEDATDKSVKWTIDDTSIASVANGVVTGFAVGETTLTATTVDGGFTASIPVKVTPMNIAVTGISLNKMMVDLTIGEIATVEAIVTPENATNKEVEWSIDNTSIATVENGVVTGVALGETTLTVTTADGGFAASIPVNVLADRIPVTGITMAAFNPAYPVVGDELSTMVMITPTNATNKKVILTCDKPELIGSINEDLQYINEGFVRFTMESLGSGWLTFTATSADGGFTSVKTTFVSPKEGEEIFVNSISILPETRELQVYQTVQLNATVSPNNATNKELEWSSSDVNVATVDANGLVTSVGVGNATITAMATDGSGVMGFATITVVPTTVTFAGNTEYEVNTWYGNIIDLEVQTAPGNYPLDELKWNYNLIPENTTILHSNITETKATVSLTYPSTYSGSSLCTIDVFSPSAALHYAKATIRCETVAWLHKFEDSDYCDGYRALIGGNNYKYNWDVNYIQTLYFVAYYNTGSNPEALPMYYSDKYIPTSEYTLTSSDPSKVKVTKEADGKGWKLERLDTTNLAAVTLTYTCGEHIQTYTINLIP